MIHQLTRKCNQQESTNLILLSQILKTKDVGIAYGLREKRAIFSPYTAREILILNMTNRSISPRVVTKHKEQMIAGKYFAVDPIKFDWNGELIDGQHRLTALAKCHPDTMIEFLVVYNCDPDVRKVIDTGRKRTNADTLGILGYKYPKLIPSLIKHTFLGHKLKFISATAQKNACCPFDYTSQLTVEQVEYMYEQHRDAIDFVLQIAQPGNSLSVTKSTAVLAPFVRAYYTQNHERLSIAIQVFYTGELARFVDKVKNVNVLGNLMKLRESIEKGKSVSGVGLRNYCLTSSCLVNFLTDTEIKHIKPITKEQFPVPTLDKVTPLSKLD
jgi:hypothetical protein